MAIFPLYNKHVVNVPVAISTDFKAGSALMYDNNGRAVLADRSSFSFDSLTEQRSKFLGFSSNDHSTTSTIINNDPVGSNYNIDSAFYDNTNAPYAAPKRSILDYRDENVNNFYQISNNNPETMRGTGVYNLEGEIYITDQFVPVLAGTYTSDGTVNINFLPGDLLTFGIGVNAGKLVKVDTSGSGPSCIIVGSVEKYQGGLLYFRYILKSYVNTASFVASNLSMNLDAGNVSSYPGTGTTWFDTTANGNNASLTNGAYWDSAGYMVTDGTNDIISVLDSNSLDFDTGDFTVESFYKGIQGGLHAPIQKSGWAIFSFYGDYGYTSWNWTIPGNNNYDLFGKTVINLGQWYHICVTRINGIKYLYIDGILQSSIADPVSYTNTSDLLIACWNGYVLTNSHIAVSRIYKGLGLSSDQVRQNYNSIYPRLAS